LNNIKIRVGIEMYFEGGIVKRRRYQERKARRYRSVMKTSDVYLACKFYFNVIICEKQRWAFVRVNTLLIVLDL